MIQLINWSLLITISWFPLIFIDKFV